MSVLVVHVASVRPEKVEAARARYAELLPVTRAYDGCEGVTLHLDQDAPGKLLLLERWASRAQYEAYVAWRMTRQDEVAAGKKLGTGEPPSVRIFDDLEA
jgi:quinol monooxygenase YgiN